jgi:hypothetical protein
MRESTTSYNRSYCTDFDSPYSVLIAQNRGNFMLEFSEVFGMVFKVVIHAFIAQN